MHPIQAAARHQCSYLVNLHVNDFLQVGGDPKWLNGLEGAPQKLRALGELNKILAHRPWLLTKTHIEVWHYNHQPPLQKSAQAFSSTHTSFATRMTSVWTFDGHCGSLKGLSTAHVSSYNHVTQHSWVISLFWLVYMILCSIMLMSFKCIRKTLKECFGNFDINFHKP